MSKKKDDDDIVQADTNDEESAIAQENADKPDTPAPPNADEVTHSGTLAGEITPEEIANHSYLVFEELRGVHADLRREIDQGSATGLSSDRARHWLGRLAGLETMFAEALGPIVPKDGTGVPDWAKKGPPFVIPDASMQLGTANETPGNPARPIRAKLAEEANVDKNG